MKLFLWPCSIAMLNYQRVYTYVIYIYTSPVVGIRHLLYSAFHGNVTRDVHIKVAKVRDKTPRKKQQVMWVKQ